MARIVIGLDIGGANLKAAEAHGTAVSQPFQLWKDPDRLSDALRTLLQSLPPADLLAVTMTGELCDCFESKRQGVHVILDAVDEVAGPTPVRVWQTDGRLVGSADARSRPLQTAAANWLALATFAGRFAPTGGALVVDIGSTTTDIVPLWEGKPVPRGRTDPERLRCRELVYTGVRRTPVCALLGSGGAAELFATTQDVYLVLGMLNEDANDRQTADGRPATVAAAHARLARMLCADLECSTEDERRKLAENIMLRQAMLLKLALEISAENVPGPVGTIILSGSGEFLGRAVFSLAEQHASPLAKIPNRRALSSGFSPAISSAACAYALAMLASEMPDGAR